MEQFIMKCSCFKRIAKYLSKNNSAFLLRFHNGRIQNKFDRTKYWLDMYMDITDGLNSELDCFFFGKDIDESLRCYSSIFDYYEKLYIGLKLSDSPLASIYSIGRPTCIEELVIKMDLLGI